MSDQDFLKLILADPEADSPRLVYADWLDEKGDMAKAEFVRVQCEAHRSQRKIRGKRLWPSASRCCSSRIGFSEFPALGPGR